MESKRINKYLSEVGFCSRRKADEYISIGRVYINGKVAELGSKVNIDDEIKVDGEIIQNTNKKKVYIAFNKPVGIECTGNQKVKDNIIDFINHKQRLFTIGRIDKQSEGLILLTNNGDIVNNVLRAENKKEKEYMVWVNKNPEITRTKNLSSGRIPKRISNDTIVNVSTNCDVKVEKLFLNQRCFPLVSFFQKWYILISIN